MSGRNSLSLYWQGSVHWGGMGVIGVELRVGLGVGGISRTGIR